MTSTTIVITRKYIATLTSKLPICYVPMKHFDGYETLTRYICNSNIQLLLNNRLFVQTTYLIKLRVSLYIVKAAFSVTLSCSIAFPVNRKYNTAFRYNIHCFIVSVSSSAICFSFFASVRYWFWSLNKQTIQHHYCICGSKTANLLILIIGRF